MEVKQLFSQIRKELDNRDEKREELIKKNRNVVRECSEAIRAIHREEFDEIEASLKKIESELQELTILGNEASDVDYTVKTHSVAYQEYVEAVILYNYVKNQPFPTYQSLHVPVLSYLTGIADAIGELRRYCLNKIRKDDLAEAERALTVMEDLQTELMTLDYPNGLIPGVRRKSDIARTLIEKTRGDITNAISRNKLLKAIEEKNQEYH